MSTIVYKIADTTEEFDQAISVRVAVFVEEQGGRRGYDPDQYDATARIFIGILDNQVVATTRARKIQPNIFKIERVAVLPQFRRQNIGKMILNFAFNEVEKDNPQRIYLSAQTRAKGFYQKCGFVRTSDEYDPYQNGVSHIDMDYQLQ